MQIDEDVLAAIAVCAELTGTVLSKPAARIFAQDLSTQPKPAVLRALERCRRELRGRLTLSDVLDRIAMEDGRPGADEAWAMCPMDEATTAVLNAWFHGVAMNLATFSTAVVRLRVSPANVAFVLALAAALGFTAGFVPALRAARLSPAEALRRA